MLLSVKISITSIMEKYHFCESTPWPNYCVSKYECSACSCRLILFINIIKFTRMKKRSFLTGSLIILLVALLTVACSKSNNNGNTNNNSPKVYMKNSVFSNTNVQITMGTTVTWINDDTMAHTVPADNGSF